MCEVSEILSDELNDESELSEIAYVEYISQPAA